MKQRTQVQELTYSVPASIIPYIQVGSVVSVPLKRRTVDGVVVGLKRQVSRDLRHKLRSLSRIKREAAIFNSAQIETIRQLADYYGASLAEVADQALVWPAGERSKATFRIKAPIFYQAPWSERKKFYLKLLSKHYPQRRLLFLFASEAYAESFLKQAGNYSVIDGSQVSYVNQTLQQRLSSKEPLVVVGLQKWAFLPMEATDLIIIDLPDHIGHQSRRRPYLSDEQIGLTRAKTEGIQLILGADCLSINEAKNENWRVLTQRLTKKELVVFNRQGSQELILPNLLTELEKINFKQKKVLGLVASLGWSNALFCSECGKVLTCPRCDHTLVATQTAAFCRYCGYKSSLPLTCELHHNTLKPIGEGIKRITLELKKSLLQTPITEISSESSAVPSVGLNVATEKINSFPDVTFDSSFILSVDRFLTGSSPEEPWHLLKILLPIRAQTMGKIYIQTHFPDHWLWSALSTGQFRSFMQTELAERQKYQLPPFGQEIGLIGRSRSASILEKEERLIRQKVSLNLPTLTFLPGVTRKVAHEFVVRLTVYSPRFLSSDQKRLLRSQLPPAWAIQINP